jgi:hypothetical protein
MPLTVVIAIGGMVFLLAIIVPGIQLLRHLLRERRHRAMMDRRTRRMEKIDRAWRESLAAKHAKTEQTDSDSRNPPPRT